MDLEIFKLLHGLVGQSAFLDQVIVFCASYLAYILGAIFVGFLVLSQMERSQRWELFWLSVASTLLARGVLTELIRHFYHRPRPFLALNFTPLFSDSAWSFPSGHATFFFALSTAVYLYNRRWGAWFFAVSALITLARVAAGVHYPSDILAGAIIGIASTWLIYSVFKTYQRRKTH
jgi:undecaprenyl-diphosphatase